MKKDIKIVVSGILGILGLVAWIYPIIGILVALLGILISKNILKHENNNIAKMGFWLSVVCLILTLINSAVGAYMGYKGMIS
ncbi:hypothetical protein [Calditerricola satsumensis]|uniref:DUF4190 domain-containing protein n=1 Tax=Calditerricola satsumensis TaxID=373054 RepID=A0A8J3FG96_9BACI|nr:hypothetical protein [Calditerricola satsumensis]GGK08343.1 hypothetical protein GCM10007043_23050 [Calditerricola satsumensis]